MNKHKDYDKPLEFLLARASDPFMYQDDKKIFVDILCERMQHEYDGPNIIIKILSHKLLSPDQNEAMISLELMDLFVRACGARVVNEIAKFRTLNQFIRLLSPKFQGAQTSPEVRTKAVFLLFNWSNSFRNYEKFRQTYELLKEQSVIEEDPKIDEEILHLSKNPTRMAVFEDEEKSQLLDALLKSKNPEDLQAANRLIKSMVRAEDIKIEKEHKRTEVLETAATNVRVLQDMLDQGTNSNQFISSNNHNDQDFILMKDIHESLLNMRPILFKYAGEAAENNEEILSEILTINDLINRCLQRYKEYSESKNFTETASNTNNLPTELISLENGTENSNDSFLPTTSNSNDDVDILVLKSVGNSPNILRKSIKDDLLTNELFSNSNYDNVQNSSKNNEIILKNENFINDNIIADLSQLDLTPRHVVIPKHDVDNIQKHKDQFLLDDVSVTLTDLPISSAEPTIFINHNFIKGLIYFTDNISIGYKNIIFTIATITSLNPIPLTNVKLKMCSTSSLVSSKLLSANQTSLRGFHPIVPPENVSQIFMLLPLSDSVKQAEISFELLFKSNTDERIEGKFVLKWV